MIPICTQGTAQFQYMLLQTFFHLVLGLRMQHPAQKVLFHKENYACRYQLDKENKVQYLFIAFEIHQQSKHKGWAMLQSKENTKAGSVNCFFIVWQRFFNRKEFGCKPILCIVLFTIHNFTTVMVSLINKLNKIIAMALVKIHCVHLQTHFLTLLQEYLYVLRNLD